MLLFQQGLQSQLARFQTHLSVPLPLAQQLPLLTLWQKRQ
jgi:hypothetical protein